MSTERRRERRHFDAFVTQSTIDVTHSSTA